MNLSFWIQGKEYKLNLVEKEKNSISVSLGKEEHRVRVELLSPDEILLNIDGRIYDVLINSNTTSYSVFINGRSFQVERKSAAQILGDLGPTQKRIEVKTFMPGRVIEVLARVGEKVEEGQAVLILEAMKMQNEIKSPKAGKVTRINPKAGDSVESNALLFTIE